LVIEAIMLNDWSGQSFPHPPGRKPVIGDLLLIDRGAPLQSLLRLAAGLGPLVELRIFQQKFVFVTDAATTAELCDESRFAKALPPAVAALREFAGDGLFTARNDEPNWRLAHDLLQPAFTRSAMQSYHDTMLGAITELFAYWDARPGPQDVSQLMTKLTMETITRAAFGRDFGSFTSAQPHPFVAAMVAALKAGRQAGGLGTLPGAGLLQRRIEKRNAHHQQYIQTMLDDLIAERRVADDTSTDDLLGIMLNQTHPETGKRLDDLNIRYQILTFLVAGHETTSGALSFALYYLSRNPDVLARAQAEVDAILGPDPDTEPAYEQVAKFRYLRRVLDESLRLWPTAPAFARSPREQTAVAGRWTMRPEDWALVILPLVHRDTAVWGQAADEFDPDRFSPERSHGRAPHSYKPFGTGERACIGRHFALHEAILVLARLLHRYDITGDPAYSLRIQERLTLQPDGFDLTLSRRTPTTTPPRAFIDDAAPAI
jgi:cytochrome P450